MYCKNCGAKINEGDMFCGNCGQPIMRENSNQPEEVQKPVVENTQAPIESAPQQMPQQPAPQPVQQPVSQQQPQQQPQITSGVQQKTNPSTEYKSSKSSFDSQKIIITIVLGIVFFVIGFECCKYYIANKAEEYLDDYYYYDDYNDYNNYNSYDNYIQEEQNNTLSVNNNQNNIAIGSTESYLTDDNGTKVTFKVTNTLSIKENYSQWHRKRIERADDDDESMLKIYPEIQNYNINEILNDYKNGFPEDFKNLKISEI